MPDADVIIVGSGFGGAVTSCRLAQAGAKVIVLERGREWGPETFPRKPTDPWVFDPNDPAKIVSSERLLQDLDSPIRAVSVTSDGTLYVATDQAVLRLGPR